jgi:hypothetical protein
MFSSSRYTREKYSLHGLPSRPEVRATCPCIQCHVKCSVAIGQVLRAYHAHTRCNQLCKHPSALNFHLTSWSSVECRTCLRVYRQQAIAGATRSSSSSGGCRGHQARYCTRSGFHVCTEVQAILIPGYIICNVERLDAWLDKEVQGRTWTSSKGL